MSMEMNKTTTTTAATTDALILNSNSSVVSNELVAQLQEQYGDGKQIYILNTPSSDTGATVQYLIVDRDVDVNVILQDPTFQAASAAQQQQQQQHVAANAATPTSMQHQPYRNGTNGQHAKVPMSVAAATIPLIQQQQPNLQNQVLGIILDLIRL